MERLAGRDQCALTRQTLRNIRDKVDGLSFLNSAFTPLVKLLDQNPSGVTINMQKVEMSLHLSSTRWWQRC